MNRNYMYLTDDEKIGDRIIEIRRRLHRIPELSFHEFKTQQAVMELLEEIGLEGECIANTGVTATIQGSGPGKCIALRTDMDGLEMIEAPTQFNSEYISQHQGFMHSCGHDAHMAMVLGAARLLIRQKDNFPGSVKLIFQPAEEQPPGGALDVIRDGGLDGVDVIVGLHVLSQIDSGEIKFRPGPFLATSNVIKIKITGKGGHHLNPELVIDPIAIAAGFIGCICDRIRMKIPQDRFILGIGKIAGGSQFNRTPDEVEVLGSFRTFDNRDTQDIEDIIRQVLDELVEMYGKQDFPGLPAYELDIEHGYPVLVNDPVFSDKVLKLLKEHFPVVGDDIKPFFGSEDFAYYLQEIPGVYIGLGIWNKEKGITEGNHSSRFDIDETVLVDGTRMLATIALDFLNDPGEYLL
ncbi:MAG: Thermostable carboxypeptidase 1 [ANME-2 cluster archaeon]|nr:Thermostable carboxypeptidase 1 [ANME-2 cluster archaeon]